MKTRTYFALVAFLLLVCAAMALAQGPGRTDARYRSGLRSVASHETVIVRVSELNRRAGTTPVLMRLIDRKGREVARKHGTVSGIEPFEVEVPASTFGSQQRELFRVDLRIFGITDGNQNTVNVDVWDPIANNLTIGWECNGPDAPAGGFSGNCDGVYQLVATQ